MIGRIGTLRDFLLALALAATTPAQEVVRIAVGPIGVGDPDVLHVPGLPEACDAARARRRTERRSELPPARIEILVSPGVHEQSRSALLDAAAGGAPGAPTVILGAGARVVGARRMSLPALTDEAPAELRDRLPTDAARAHVRWIDLPAAGIDRPGRLTARGMGRATVPGASELFWNGVPLTLARWPDAGFATLLEVIDPGSVPRDAEPDVAGPSPRSEPPRGGTFRVADPRVARWADAVGEAWLCGYWQWDWADELLPLARVDPVSQRVTLGLPHHYGIGDAARFFVQNALEELDRPGEYVLLADAQRIAVWPPEVDPDAPPPEILVSTLAEPLIRVDDAQHVEIRNLTLGATRDCAIRVDGGAFVTIAGCTVRGTGAHGIVLRGLRHRVVACTLQDIGAAAITLDGGDRATLTPSGHVVEDCEISRFARLERTYRPAVAISGVGARVAHNHVHDAPHTAILVAGNDHVIENNEIHDVLLETGDCGAIYMGRDWAMHGVIVRHNLIRDLPGTVDRWQNAIYLDDMASGITVEGNVLLRCNLGMLIGGGRDLTIRHNVFVDCSEGLRFDARGVGWMAKAIADPSTSTLHRRLAALPVASAPWSTRYPTVQHTLTRGFGRPIGSTVRANAFFRTRFGEVADAKSVTVDGNRSFSRAPALGQPVLDIRAIPGFPPLPIGDVGPRGAR